MNLWKKITMRKNDRDAVIILLLVIVVAVVLFPFLGEKNTEGLDQQSRPKYYAVPDQQTHVRLVAFDPNTADSTLLLSLGLQPWQVRSIYKYRAKGGRYRKKEDFARLYGLTLKQYRMLEPYIRIVPEVMAADVVKAEVVKAEVVKADVVEKKNSDNKNTSARYSSSKISAGERININKADTTELKRIPGIGSYFARRIVELRQRKGVFTAVEDVMAIRNMPETAMEYMTVDVVMPKIHINKWTQKELEHHPLLNYVQARDIIRLRKSSGDVSSIKDLTLLPSFNDELLKRLEPLLEF